MHLLVLRGHPGIACPRWRLRLLLLGRRSGCCSRQPVWETLYLLRSRKERAHLRPQRRTRAGHNRAGPATAQGPTTQGGLRDRPSPGRKTESSQNCTTNTTTTSSTSAAAGCTTTGRGSSRLSAAARGHCAPAGSCDAVAGSTRQERHTGWVIRVSVRMDALVVHVLVVQVD